MATFGPWAGAPANMQRACAVEGCHEDGKPHACPYDGSMHHHGCIHYRSHPGTVGLTFRDGWGWLCDTHYQTIMADLARHQDAPHQPATHDGPKSCYPEDVATLREMLAEVRESLADAEQGIADRRAIAGYTWKKAQAERRIEALQTAIEALGGAL